MLQPVDVEFSSVDKDFLFGTFTDILWDVIGVKRCFNRYKALHDISFKVPRGELLGVLGRNGAGKSTLLRVAGGIYSPDSGKVYMRTNPTALIEMGLYGNQHLTGRQFCEIYLAFRDIPKRTISELIEDIWEFSELDNYFDESILTYSSGMAARLMFGAITAVPARIVLLDEILSVGDQHFQGKSYARLMNMISRGASGILATHDWFTAVRLCSKIMILDKGDVQFHGSSLEAVRRYLDLAPTLTGKVFFCDKDNMTQTPLSVAPGKPLELTFDVESTINTPFSIRCALEIPRLAMVVIVTDDYVIRNGKGCYRVSLEISEFPVNQPECLLSLFIGKPRRQGEGATRELYDQISWTTGNSIRLINEEAQFDSMGVIHRPLQWRRLQ